MCIIFPGHSYDQTKMSFESRLNAGNRIFYNDGAMMFDPKIVTCSGEDIRLGFAF